MYGPIQSGFSGKLVSLTFVRESFHILFFSFSRVYSSFFTFIHVQWNKAKRKKNSKKLSAKATKNYAETMTKTKCISKLSKKYQLKNNLRVSLTTFYAYSLHGKCPNTAFFLVRIFPHSDWIRRDTRIKNVHVLEKMFIKREIWAGKDCVCCEAVFVGYNSIFVLMMNE